MDRDLLFLRAAFYYNKARFSYLSAKLKDRVFFGPGCDVWVGSFRFIGQGEAAFGEGCVVERSSLPFHLEVEKGGRVELAPRLWVRGKYRPNVITCFEGARIEIGEDSLLNGTIISSRSSVIIGRRACLSWDTAILDSSQHPISNLEPMVIKPVRLGDNVLIGTGVKIMPGAEIGSNSLIGASSVVTGTIPPNSLAAGVPARVMRRIDDRDLCH